MDYIKENHRCESLSLSEIDGCNKEQVLEFFTSRMDRAQEKYPNHNIVLDYDYSDYECTICARTYETKEQRDERLKEIEVLRKKDKEKFEKAEYRRLKRLYGNEDV